MVIYGSHIQHFWRTRRHMMLSGVSNGSVWVLEGKRVEHLRSFCGLGAELVWIVWEVPHLWKFMVMQWTDGNYTFADQGVACSLSRFFYLLLCFFLFLSLLLFVAQTNAHDHRQNQPETDTIILPSILVQKLSGFKNAEGRESAKYMMWTLIMIVLWFWNRNTERKKSGPSFLRSKWAMTLL